MVVCKYCGRMIDFVKLAKGGKKIPVAPRAECFIPDEIGGTEVFVTPRGEVRKGRRATDGIKGHMLHKCRNG